MDLQQHVDGEQPFIYGHMRLNNVCMFLECVCAFDVNKIDECYECSLIQDDTDLGSKYSHIRRKLRGYLGKVFSNFSFHF